MNPNDGLGSEIRTRLGKGSVVEIAQVGVMKRLLVVSPEFDGKGREERRKLAFGASVPPDVLWFELLTPEELAEEPDLKSQMLAPDAPLPTWSDTLVRGSISRPRPIFRTEAPIEGPLITTFFSLRGGVGRSTALAAVGHLLSDPDGPYAKRVLALDLDLEAPGLAPLLGVEDRVHPGTGVVALLNQVDVEGGAISEEELDRHWINLSPTFLLLPAGLPDANYAAGLARVTPDVWYEENPSNTPFHRLLGAITGHPWAPEVLLIDARTGLSAVTAPLLFDLSHVVIVCFYPHPQTKLGTEAVVGGLIRSGDGASPRPYFVAAPVPVGGVGETQEARALEWVTQWIEPINKARSESSVDQILPEDQLAIVRYSEATAVSDRVDRSQAESYAKIADWLAGNSTSVESGTTSPPPEKSEVLQSIQFGTVAGEELSPEQLDAIFLATDDVRRALLPETTLVTGRKGTGKSTIFNKLAQGSTVRIGLSPVRFSGETPVQRWLSPDQFLHIDKTLRRVGLPWASFWTWHIAIVWLAAAGVDAPEALAPTATPDQYLTALEGHGDKLGTIGTRLLADLNDAHTGLVLFDGLDSQFGSDTEGRRRRLDAVSGLLDVAINWSLRNVRLKVLLRHDLYRSAQAINKSHLRSRQVDLRWSSQYDFLAVGLKQILTSIFLRAHIANAGSVLSALLSTDTPLEEWPESAIIDAWHRFTTERMAGGDTAFTRNWVYTRLADANEDRTPRNLHLLLKEAVILELAFTSRGQLYGTSLVRPRALSDALANTVSGEAVDALENDEFPELQPLLEVLRTVPKTPFTPDVLVGVTPDLVELAQEVGLVAIDTRKEPHQVRVPELYRYGLGIGRRGQV